MNISISFFTSFTSVLLNIVSHHVYGYTKAVPYVPPFLVLTRTQIRTHTHTIRWIETCIHKKRLLLWNREWYISSTLYSMFQMIPSICVHVNKTTKSSFFYNPRFSWNFFKNKSKTWNWGEIGKDDEVGGVDGVSSLLLLLLLLL